MAAGRWLNCPSSRSGNEIQSPFTSTLILWGIADAFMLVAFIAVLPLLWGTWSGRRMEGTVSALAAGGGGGAGRAVYRTSIVSRDARAIAG